MRYITSHWEQKPDNLRELVSEDVELQHSTNGKVDFTARGAVDYLNTVREKYYNKVGTIDVQSFYIQSNGLTPKYVLTVRQNMKEGDENKSIDYRDCTVLTIEQIAEKHLITHIQMNINRVEREP
jgi:hypothetical protein